MKEVNMRKKTVLTAVFLVLASTLLFVIPACSQTTLETICIRPDGSVYPSAAPIQQNGNTYTFTDNFYGAIRIQKNNIVLDGAGFTLHGPYDGAVSDIWFIGEGTGQLAKSTQVQYTIGVDLGSPSVEGVVIENLNIKNFSIGMYVWTRSNTVVGNAVSENIIGILLSGSNATVTKNFIANNQRGLFFGFNNAEGTIPSDIIINRNAFENNVVQLNGCECKDYNTTEFPHNWDDGKEGNYWSDYNGTDTNNDGIGDTPYFIDILNQDRFPLMQRPAKPQVLHPKIPVEAIILGVLASVALPVALFAFKKRKKKQNLKEPPLMRLFCSR
jgi:nitrous oxidase accessory protein NosD